MQVEVDTVRVREDRWGNILIYMKDTAGNTMGEIVMGFVDAEKLKLDLGLILAAQASKCVLCGKGWPTGMSGMATSVQHPGRVQHYPSCPS